MRVLASRSGSAARCAMSGSALCYSLVPLGLALLGGTAHPFLFNGYYRLGAALGALLWLFLSDRRRFLTWSLWASLWRRLRGPDAVLLSLPYFGYTAFAWSARYVDVAVTAVVQEVWPVLFVLLTVWLWRGAGRFRRLGRRDAALFAACFGAAVLAVYAEHGDFGRWTADGDAGAVATGVGLAVLAALLISGTGYSLRWAACWATAAVAQGGDVVGERRRAELFGLLVMFFAGSLVSAAANLGLGLLTETGGPPADWRRLFLGSLAAGVLLDALGTVGHRWANLMTDDLAVNVLAYATPLLGLGWLHLTATTAAARPDLLLVAALGLLCAHWLLLRR